MYFISIFQAEISWHEVNFEFWRWIYVIGNNELYAMYVKYDSGYICNPLE